MKRYGRQAARVELAVDRPVRVLTGLLMVLCVEGPALLVPAGGLWIGSDHLSPFVKALVEPCSFATLHGTEWVEATQVTNNERLGGEALILGQLLRRGPTEQRLERLYEAYGVRASGLPDWVQAEVIGVTREHVAHLVGALKRKGEAPPAVNAGLLANIPAHLKGALP